LLLMILALIFFIADIKAPTHGALTIGGIIAMIFGSLMLIESPAPYMRISIFVILCVVAATAAFFFFAVGMGLKAQRRKPTTGDKGMIGMIGVTRSRLDPEGYVFVRGELWKVIADQTIEIGEKIKVLKVEDLTLRVTKA